MHNRPSITPEENRIERYPVDLEADTARWTSPAFQIRFGHITELAQQSYEIEAFRVSAWGLSEGLSQLLSDYPSSMLHHTLDTLIVNQNAHMVMMLNEAMTISDFNYDILDQVFITIDTEIFLPGGLRMHVACVTNIAQVNSDTATLDKFVAILDPGEAEHYIRERRGMTLSPKRHTIH